MARKMKIGKHSRQTKKLLAQKSRQERAEKQAVGHIDPEAVESFCNKITTFLTKANGRPVSRADLAAKCRGRGQRPYLRALDKLCKEGIIAERHSGYVLAERVGMYRAVITMLHRTYGYASKEGESARIFIPGRDLHGAMNGDLVLLQPTGERDGTPEASVVTVIEEAQVRTAGVLVVEDGTLRFLPDTLCRCADR